MNVALSKPFRHVRLMQSQDLPTIMEIEKIAYPFPWTLQIFRDCLRVGYLGWVLELNFKVVGYGLVSIGVGEAHILNLCVHPDYQRQGCGRYILEHLLTIARHQAVETVFLEVRSSNQVAINLYTQLGFNQVGIRKNYYPALCRSREDALILALVLL